MSNKSNKKRHNSKKPSSSKHKTTSHQATLEDVPMETFSPATPITQSSTSSQEQNPEESDQLPTIESSVSTLGPPTDSDPGHDATNSIPSFESNSIPTLPLTESSDSPTIASLSPLPAQTKSNSNAILEQTQPEEKPSTVIADRPLLETPTTLSVSATPVSQSPGIMNPINPTTSSSLHDSPKILPSPATGDPIKPSLKASSTPVTPRISRTPSNSKYLPQTTALSRSQNSSYINFAKLSTPTSSTLSIPHSYDQHFSTTELLDITNPLVDNPTSNPLLSAAATSTSVLSPSSSGRLGEFYYSASSSPVNGSFTSLASLTSGGSSNNISSHHLSGANTSSSSVIAKNLLSGGNTIAGSDRNLRRTYYSNSTTDLLGYHKNNMGVHAHNTPGRRLPSRKSTTSLGKMNSHGDGYSQVPRRFPQLNQHHYKRQSNHGDIDESKIHRNPALALKHRSNNSIHSDLNSPSTGTSTPRGAFSSYITDNEEDNQINPVNSFMESIDGTTNSFSLQRSVSSSILHKGLNLFGNDEIETNKNETSASSSSESESSNDEDEEDEEYKNADDYFGLPKGQSSIQNNDDPNDESVLSPLLVRAGSRVWEEIRETKGQSWLATRPSASDILQDNYENENNYSSNSLIQRFPRRNENAAEQEEYNPLSYQSRTMIGVEIDDRDTDTEDSGDEERVENGTNKSESQENIGLRGSHNNSGIFQNKFNIIDEEEDEDEENEDVGLHIGDVKKMKEQQALKNKNKASKQNLESSINSFKLDESYVFLKGSPSPGEPGANTPLGVSGSKAAFPFQYKHSDTPSPRTSNTPKTTGSRQSSQLHLNQISQQQQLPRANTINLPAGGTSTPTNFSASNGKKQLKKEKSDEDILKPSYNIFIEVVDWILGLKGTDSVSFDIPDAPIYSSSNSASSANNGTTTTREKDKKKSNEKTGNEVVASKVIGKSNTASNKSNWNDYDFQEEAEQLKLRRRSSLLSMSKIHPPRHMLTRQKSLMININENDEANVLSNNNDATVGLTSPITPVRKQVSIKAEDGNIYDLNNSKQQLNGITTSPYRQQLMMSRGNSSNSSEQRKIWMEEEENLEEIVRTMQTKQYHITKQRDLQQGLNFDVALALGYLAYIL